MSQNSKYKLRGDKDETINHVASVVLLMLMNEKTISTIVLQKIIKKFLSFLEAEM